MNKKNILIVLVVLIFTTIGFIIGFIVSESQKPVDKVQTPSTNEEEIKINEQDINNLYDTYIHYSEYETNDYKNININDSTSDEYLVKFAIYKILEENSVDINNYSWGYEEELNGYSNGYVIKTQEINECVKKYFNIERTIDFENLQFNFSVNSNISQHYFKEENLYRLIADDSIPKTGGVGGIIHSKLVKYEKIDNNIIIYTEYFLMDYDMEQLYINSSVDDMGTMQYYLDASLCNWKLDKECILNNYSDKVGKFKHIFTKDDKGNYSYISTQKIN